MNACFTFAVRLVNCWSTFESPLHRACCKIITGHLEVLVPGFMHVLQVSVGLLNCYPRHGTAELFLIKVRQSRSVRKILNCHDCNSSASITPAMVREQNREQTNSFSFYRSSAFGARCSFWLRSSSCSV